MTDRLEDESAWAEHLYAEADPRAESKETMEVRLNSRLVKERLAIASSSIVSKMHHRSVERHWTLVSVL